MEHLEIEALMEIQVLRVKLVIKDLRDLLEPKVDKAHRDQRENAVKLAWLVIKEKLAYLVMLVSLVIMATTEKMESPVNLVSLVLRVLRVRKGHRVQVDKLEFLDHLVPKVLLVHSVSQVVRVNLGKVVKREKLEQLEVQEAKAELVIQVEEVLKVPKVTWVLKVCKVVLDRKEIGVRLDYLDQLDTKEVLVIRVPLVLQELLAHVERGVVMAKLDLQVL